MRRAAAALILAMLIASTQAAEVVTAMKSPLSYSLQQYGLVLAVSVFSGVVRWIIRLRAGLVPTAAIAALVGEACISVSVGLMTFWLCEWQSYDELLTIALVALAGHMGGKALLVMEKVADKVLQKRLAAWGITWPEEERKRHTRPAPLDDGRGGP